MKKISENQVKYLITGCTGVIGRNLITRLKDSGVNASFYLYARDRDYTNQVFNDVPGVIFTDFSKLSHNEYFDYVIHLGEDKSIYDSKWNAESVAAILEDNRKLNVALREYLQKLKYFPKRIIFASTIDCYGYEYVKHDPDSCLSFIYRPSFHEGFYPASFNTTLPHLLAQQNDQFAIIMRQSGMSLVLVRMGIVLDRESLMIDHYAKMLKMWKIGKIGCGYQPFNWIHSHDAVNALLYLLDANLANLKLKIINLVASSNGSQKTSFQDFCFCLAALNHYKGFINLPEGLAKFFIGEKVYKITQGNHVYSMNLDKIGFKVEYDTIQKALFQIYCDSVALPSKT